jgi:hypothetical protein
MNAETHSWAPSSVRSEDRIPMAKTRNLLKIFGTR